MNNVRPLRSVTQERADDQPLPRRLIIQRGQNGARRHGVTQAQRALRLLSPFLLLALWEILSQTGVLDRRFFPPPSEILASGLHLVQDGTLGEAVIASMRRLAIGYACGAAGGIVVGLALGLSRWFRALAEPWLLITYPVPKLALYPLLVLLVGLGEPPILILLAITVFYIVAINAMAGVLSIKQVILDVGRDCNASFLQSVRTIALPASMPHIMTGLEVSLGLACVVLVAAEFVGAKSGLGYLIWSSWQLFDVSPMYVAITTVSVLGYLCALVLRLIGRTLMPWHRAS